jgi:DNA repair protein RadC
MSTTNKNKSIKEWALDDRPREKALAKGVEVLSDSELIAVLLGNGTRNKSAVDLAKDLLEYANNDLQKLATISTTEMRKAIKGIGPAKSIILKVALELAKRKQLAQQKIAPKFLSSNQFYELFKPLLEDSTQEKFVVVFLSSNLSFIAIETINIGSAMATVVDIPSIVKRSLHHDATRIVVAHNHPSGGLEPSMQDKAITVRLFEAAKLLDIQLVDHLIVSKHGYYSFSDQGEL